MVVVAAVVLLLYYQLFAIGAKFLFLLAVASPASGRCVYNGSNLLLAQNLSVDLFLRLLFLSLSRT